MSDMNGTKKNGFLLCGNPWPAEELREKLRNPLPGWERSLSGANTPDLTPVPVDEPAVGRSSDFSLAQRISYMERQPQQPERYTSLERERLAVAAQVLEEATDPARKAYEAAVAVMEVYSAAAELPRVKALVKSHKESLAVINRELSEQQRLGSKVERHLSERLAKEIGNNIETERLLARTQRELRELKSRPSPWLRVLRFFWRCAR